MIAEGIVIVCGCMILILLTGFVLGWLVGFVQGARKYRKTKGIMFWKDDEPLGNGTNESEPVKLL